MKWIEIGTQESKMDRRIKWIATNLKHEKCQINQSQIKQDKGRQDTKYLGSSGKPCSMQFSFVSSCITRYIESNSNTYIYISIYLSIRADYIRAIVSYLFSRLHHDIMLRCLIPQFNAKKKVCNCAILCAISVPRYFNE